VRTGDYFLGVRLEYNPLQNLTMKWWHAILMTTSFFVFIVSLTIELKVFSNETIAFISSGAFFIGLGEFANQSFQVGINPVTRITTKRDIRIHTFFGYLFDLIGIILILKGFKVF